MHSFRKGEIVLTEAPFATSVLDERLGDTCNWCFRFKFAHPTKFSEPIKCSECSQVVYCSEKCRDKDALYHSLECLFLQDSIEDFAGNKRFFLRALARIQDEEKSGSTSVGSFFEYQRTFKDLKSHADRMKGNRLKLFSVVSEGLSCFLSQHGHDVSPDVLLEISMKLVINGNGVTNFEVVSRTGPLQLGNACYLGASKSKHSCEFITDFIHLFEGNRLIIKATEDFTISDPMEITCSYIPLKFSASVRRELLKERYYFTCECKRCLEEVEEYADSPTDTHLEKLLHGKLGPETMRLLEVMEEKLAPLTNWSFYQTLVASKLFLEGDSKNVKRTFYLATSALNGTRDQHDRMRILYFLCQDLAKFGANKPSHEFYPKFKEYHELSLKTFAEIFGEDHVTVKKLAILAVSDAKEGAGESATAKKKETDILGSGESGTPAKERTDKPGSGDLLVKECVSE